MKPPGPPRLLPSIAFAAILPTSAFALAEYSVPATSIVATTSEIWPLAFIGAALGEAWFSLQSWIGDNYSRAPALVLVLSVLIALPPLAVAGWMLRGQRAEGDKTQLLRSSGRRAQPITTTKTVRTEISSWPTEAWVEIPTEPGARYVVSSALLRIGREADNDICLTERTVHRYHAVIRRTSDGDVLVTDLSGAEGNGVLINGKRIGEGRLAAGDVIAIGEVKLKFDARPV